MDTEEAVAVPDETAQTYNVTSDGDAQRNEDVVSFLEYVGKLKHLKRTGWLLFNIKDPESVAGHMYRMSVMTWLLDDSININRQKCMELALVHDLAECIVGDITPHCGVSQEEKHEREKNAMNKLTKLTDKSGHHIKALYEEYVEQKTPEARLVKELDRLDMLVQAYEYEKQESSPGKLEDFFKSCEGKFTHPFVLSIEAQIKKLRSSLFKIQDT